MREALFFGSAVDLRYSFDRLQTELTYDRAEDVADRRAKQHENRDNDNSS